MRPSGALTPDVNSAYRRAKMLLSGQCQQKEIKGRDGWLCCNISASIIYIYIYIDIYFYINSKVMRDHIFLNRQIFSAT